MERGLLAVETDKLATREVIGRPTLIGIINAGSQLLKPIDRKIREIGADTVILESDISAEQLQAACDAFVISGGGDSVYDPASPQLDTRIFQKDYPLAGLVICFGFQAMNQALGGTVEAGAKGRYGQCTIDISDDTSSPLFHGFAERSKVLMNAGDCVTPDNLAPGLRPLAVSREGDHITVAAFADETGRKVGVQFHPEVDLTERGEDIFRHFIRDVAGLPLNYTPEAKRAIVSFRIASKVTDGQVATAASGGVDSSVLAAAVHDEIGERQHVIHIDTGLMRKGESALVMDAFRERGLPNLHLVDATREFRHGTTMYKGHKTRQLQYETDPEAKRHIIGDTFSRVLEAKFRELGLDPSTAYLAQGTLRPDLIESAGIGRNAKKIKTHHNDSPLIREWRERGMIVEPLSDLHKDEVRELGLELGLPEDVVWRQPFPGPGLGIRIICAEEPADFEGRPQVEEALREYADYETSVHLLPIRTVGVQGDDRTYRHVAAVTAYGEPDWPRYMEYAREIPKVFREISRVIFVFGEQVAQSRSLFDTIVPTRLAPATVELLQEADDLVNQAAKQHNLLRKISQEPVILTPAQLDRTQAPERLLVARPFVTNDFMVGVAPVPGSEYLPFDALRAQQEAALSVKGIGRFAIDLTSKPPGTTEWE